MAVIDEAHTIAWLLKPLHRPGWVSNVQAPFSTNAWFRQWLDEQGGSNQHLDARASTVEQGVPGTCPAVNLLVIPPVTTAPRSCIWPSRLVRHTPMTGEAFSVLVPEDAAAWDAVVAGRGLAGVGNHPAPWIHHH